MKKNKQHGGSILSQLFDNNFRNYLRNSFSVEDSCTVETVKKVYVLTRKGSIASTYNKFSNL